ncbi:E3 ubiquitin-protein ligase RNF135-like isoform X1 [Bufo gargarizans]|uniref:E3 ubiquitin-protein ligase RNF135-like isoform X1 n=1 Tax=Bufo gargarizans TaxID=30331 RepID=UPI001CF3C90E|nr:E3 ubiquitin-protein ligase RNF135-like isoform X1 [Bufo gargarizans]
MEEEKLLVLRLQPQDLVCTVCFSYYVHPSTLPCGHTFCRGCLEKYWADDARCNCPLCLKNFKERPELNKNTDLSALLDALQAQDSRAHERCPSCTGAGALRLCLPCGAPLCQEHLVLHQDPTGRQRHLLVSLITAPWPCMQHDRGLEYFCVSHSSPLCPECAVQHEECHPVHLLELYRKKQEIMRRRISHLEESITSKEHIISRHKDAYREIQILISDIKDNLTRDFREMRDYLEKQERAAFWRMKQEQDSAQRETSQLVQKLIADLDDMKRQKAQLEEQLEYDWISMLKDVKSEEIFTTSASHSPYTFDENRIVDTTDAVTQMKRSVLSHALLESTPCPPKQVLEDSLELSPGSSQPGEQEISASLQVKPPSKLLQWATVVSFDRDTVSCRLSLSSDLKTVTVADKNYSYPKNERRFLSCQALCSEGLSVGCTYWEVSTADSNGWGIGVAASEIGKSQQLGDSDLSWCVKWNKERLSAWHKNEEIRIPLPQPSIVGVLLDCTEKLLSFYSVSPETEILIHTFRVHFQTCLFPAVWLYGLNKGKSLTIRDIKRTNA